MKKTTQLLAFSLFMLTNSVQFITALDNQSTCSSDASTSYDSDDSSSCDVISSYDKDNIATCHAITTIEIEKLKSLIVPGQELIAVKLLAPEISFDNYDLKGYTFIHLLTEQLDVEITSMLESHFSKAEIKTYQAKLVELIKYSVSIGIDIDAQTDGNQSTALMLAVKSYKIEVVDLLINLGANLEIKDENGYTALLGAVKNYDECLYVSALLMTFGKQDSSDYYEVAHCIASSIEIMQTLIRSGADISAQYKDGDTIRAYLNRAIDHVDEAFEYFNFDKEMQSISTWGFEINLCSTADFHKALVELKQNLEALKIIIENPQSL